MLCSWLLLLSMALLPGIWPVPTSRASAALVRAAACVTSISSAPAFAAPLLAPRKSAKSCSSTSSTATSGPRLPLWAAGNRGLVIDDSYLSAILGRCEATSSSATASLPLLLNQGMEYSHESVRPAEGEGGVGNYTGISERLNAMMGGELNSLILGSTWDSMPGMSHVDDLEFE